MAGPATRLLHVRHAALLAALSAQPGHWRELGLLMAQKLRLVFVELEEAATLPVAQRLARRLMLMAGGYGLRREGAPGMHRRSMAVSQEQLARMLSVTRQTINQNLKELESRGVLRLTRGGLEILDLPGLRALATLAD
jgi:CRP/FNR family cyclic AMP-dependent transcriptional regulator